MKKIAIVILHYGGQELTKGCLASAEKLKTNNFSLQTVVVNNNPQEDLDKLKRRFKKIVFLETGENLGFAGGNNFGIKYALKNGADFVLILNNDTLLDDKDLLTQLVAVGNQSAILGPKIHFASGFEYHQERYTSSDLGKVIWYAGGIIDWQNILIAHRGVDELDQGQYDVSEETDFVSGCALFAGHRVFEKIGLFDERYFLYLEDLEFCQRAKSAGFKIRYVPQAKLWHKNAGSSSVGSPLHDYFITRNRLLFGLKYGRLRTKWALLRESLRLLVSGRPWQKIGVADFYLAKFGRGSWK